VHITSWNSAVVRFIDRDAVIGALREAVAEAKTRYPEITKVYLFGSLLNGTWTAASDADLIVVVRKEFREFGDSCPYQIYTPAIPTDSLVYSEDDFTKLADDPTSFVAINLKDAILL
jgi:nucleotidyltransferase-like protein